MSTTSDVKKKSRPRRRNEDAILSAAEAVFAEFGYAGATTSQIARRAGIPKANLHYYYPAKEDLYRAVIANIFEIWTRPAEAFDDCDDPGEALARYIGAKMDISREHPVGSKIWAQEIMQGGPHTQDYLETTLKAWTESRVKVIKRWIAEGKITAVDPHHLLYMIWAATQHYADFEHQIEVLNDGKGLSDKQFAEAKHNVTQMILRGVGIDPEGLAVKT